jgi:Electron transfer DM13
LLYKGATLAIIAAAVVVASAAAYFLILNLFSPTQVNEPSSNPTQVNQPPVSVDMASQEYHKFIGMNEQDRMHAAAQMTPNEQSTIMREASRVTTGIEEFMPGTANQAVAVIRSGSIIGADGHLAEGIAKILSVNGTEYLRLEHFKVTNGPDLHVYLTPNGGNIQNAKDVGILKGSEGDQNYFLGNVGNSGYDAAVIFSQPFRVLFATATLR